MSISCSFFFLARGRGASIMSISYIVCLWNGPGGQHHEHQLPRLILARGRGASIMSISCIVCEMRRVHYLFVEWAGGPASCASAALFVCRMGWGASIMNISCSAWFWQGAGGPASSASALFVCGMGRGASIMSISCSACFCEGAEGQHSSIVCF